jgi:hypothetical protein
MWHSDDPMNNHVRALVAGTVLLLACGPLYYTTRLLDPFLRAHGAVSDAPGFGSDLYPRWVGIRAIFNHENPYSEAISNSIQTGYYGHVLRMDERRRDPQRFAYPAHVAILLAPLALLDFRTAQALFGALLGLTTVLATLMWLGIERRPDRDALSLGMAVVLILASWPVVQGIYARQITLLVAALLAGVFYCVSRNWLGVAGLLLAFATVKPQLSWLAVAWLLAWSVSDGKRRKLAWWFAGSALSLLLLSEFLVPGWPRAWLFTLHDYLSYTGSRLNFQVLTGTVAGACITVSAGGLCGLVLWRARGSDGASEQFGFAVALLLVLTLVVLPTWSWASYNQVLLIPAAVYLWRHGREVMPGRIGLRLVYALTVLALGWSYLATLYLTLAHLTGTVIRQESQLWLPTVNFFVVAPLTLLCVYLLRPRACRSLGSREL